MARPGVLERQRHLTDGCPGAGRLNRGVQKVALAGAGNLGELGESLLAGLRIAPGLEAGEQGANGLLGRSGFGRGGGRLGIGGGLLGCAAFLGGWLVVRLGP